MCGIAGFVALNRPLGSEAATALAEAMATAISYRGPDDAGVWCDSAGGVALSHRRLAIIDLSPAGHQPMHSASGRYVVVYNGEVYNHEALRKELARAGATFSGSSDTEVLLEGFARWGVTATLDRLVGMFAIGLWDRQDRTLTLIRDRLGIKPLYWSYRNGTLIFGSELKALARHPDFPRRLNRNAVASFLRHNYIPAPLSAYEDVAKLEPGTMLTLAPGSPPRIDRYWDFRTVARRGIEQRADAGVGEGGLASAADRLEPLLREAVGCRMVADVPLGALLSGGIDSSVVAALMQAQSARPVKTFSIGFEESGFNEAPHAKAVATHLGTDHTELYVSPSHALDVIPKLPSLYDEPFADSSQIPTYLVCELTRQHVTVVLSGDGGDELFCGYNRYLDGERLWRHLSRIPAAPRRLLGSTLRAIPEGALDRAALLLPASRRPKQFGYKVHKVAGSFATPTPDALYRQLLSHWTEPDALVQGGREHRGELWDDSVIDRVPSFTERMQYLDTLTYLPDDILTKVDRASMAVSLEARVPLIDHRVVEFAWTLPLETKLRGSEGKRVLREVLYRYVPRALIDRPKMGFGIPIDGWLRGPLKEWAEDLLSERRLKEQELLDPLPIRRAWAAHQSGDNWAYHLWDVLMLQAWLDHYQVSL